MSGFPILDYPYHVYEIPKLRHDASGHGGRDAQALVYANEIVVHEVDRDRMGMILSLF